jgi:hypothetical protein
MPYPALLTTTSTRLNFSIAVSKTVAVWDFEVTSRASRRRFGLDGRREGRGEMERAVAMTRWFGVSGEERICFARARPMPEEQPVMSQTRPLSCGAEVEDIVETTVKILKILVLRRLGAIAGWMYLRVSLTIERETSVEMILCGRRMDIKTALYKNLDGLWK